MVKNVCTDARERLRALSLPYARPAQNSYAPADAYHASNRG
jgi:hypothetical protein